MSLLKKAEDLKNLANRFKGLIDVADALDKIGSIEQAEIEAKHKTEKAKVLQAEAEALADKAAVRLKLAEQDVAKVYAASEASTSRANNLAHNKLVEAEAKADAIVQHANQKKSEMESACNIARATLVEIQAEVSINKASLEALKQEMASIKGKLSAFVKS